MDIADIYSKDMLVAKILQSLVLVIFKIKTVHLDIMTYYLHWVDRVCLRELTVQQILIYVPPHRLTKPGCSQIRPNLSDRTIVPIGTGFCRPSNQKGILYFIRYHFLNCIDKVGTSFCIGFAFVVAIELEITPAFTL